MAKRELREEARRLRQQGIAVREIAKTLNVAQSSISLWVRDIVLTEQQVESLKEQQFRYRAQSKGSQTNREKFKKLRITYQEAGRAKAREGRPLHMAGCMLYWAEGGKKKNGIYFVNSDPNMMLLFMRFLREELQVEDSAITLYIHCHSSVPEEMHRIEEYWTTLLGLPLSCLRKTQVKKGSEIRRNILSNGVCGIMVCKTELVHHIYGAIQEYGSFTNPAWLF